MVMGKSVFHPKYVFRNMDDEADKGWQFIQVESVNGSNEDELRAGRSMQGHRKGELQIQ